MAKTDAAKRVYRSPRRDLQAAATRDAVVSAATALFVERGWSGTGMRDVAETAGVALKTTYASVGSKIDLLLAAVDAAIVGDSDPVALAERVEFASLAEGPTDDRVAAASQLITTIHRRTASLHAALREAAITDQGAADRRRALEDRRRQDTEDALTRIVGQSVDGKFVDGVWAISGSDVYTLLTSQAGWRDEHYERWLTDTVLRLLGQAPADTRDDR